MRCGAQRCATDNLLCGDVDSRAVVQPPAPPAPGMVETMALPPTAPLVATGLVGGFATARYTGRRELGGLVLAAAGGVCGRAWLRSSGPGVMGLLLGLYAAAFGVSHPLAKKVGAWPSVLAVTAVASGSAYALADRSGASF